MSIFEGRLPLYVAAGAMLLCTHVAIAAVPETAQDGPPAAPSPTVTVDRTPTLDTADAPPMAGTVVAPTRPAADMREVECIAKVIRHEAANQPVAGQLAVAQVVRARTRDGRFPTTACGVVRQEGQFFDVDAYDPPRNDARWALAVRIAIQTLEGEAEETTEGALFFQSGGAPMEGRVRLARIADHVFYR